MKKISMRARVLTASLSLAVALPMVGAMSAANAAPVAPPAPGDVNATVVLGPITPTSPLLVSQSGPDGMTGPYYASAKTLGGLRYTLPLPAGATNPQVSADYGKGVTWFTDNWQNPDFTTGILINGKSFATFTPDQQQAQEDTIERDRVVNGVLEITAPIFGAGQPSRLTGYRYTDGAGNVVTHNLNLMTEAPANFQSVANPDTATVAPGATTRNYFLANDYEGLTAPYYSRYEMMPVGIQDPNTGKYLSLFTKTAPITIAGKGSFTYGIDVAKAKAAFPQSFDANGGFIGDWADYLKAGAYLDFTADPGYTGDVPAIAYRFGENTLDGSTGSGSTGTGSGSGTPTKAYETFVSPTTVIADTANNARTDALTLGTCDISAFSTPVKTVNADGSTTSTFDVTNSHGVDWGTSPTAPFAVGEVIDVGVSKSDTPNYAPKLTVVKESNAVLTLSYSSPDGANLMVGQYSCVATPVVHVPNKANSTITFTVAGTPVTTPDTPAPVVPENPTGDSVNLPVVPVADAISRPFANMGNTSANFGGPTKTEASASVTPAGDNTGLLIADGGLATILGLLIALRKKASKVVAIKVRKEQ